jgi:cysteine sulfinate desulfinase/cysteine desulfurase-like protein
MSRIYLDNAATTPLDPVVLDHAYVELYYTHDRSIVFSRLR